jgi:hypothetical protein
MLLKNKVDVIASDRRERNNLVFLVGNPRLLRRFAPPASPGEAGAGLAMTNHDFFRNLLGF